MVCGTIIREFKSRHSPNIFSGNMLKTNVFKLIRRFNYNFPSLTTKQIKNKLRLKVRRKRFYQKTIFSRVYTQKLFAKQQLKHIYDINERQLKRCIKLAFSFDKKNMEGIVLNIYNILESLLYYVLFKKGFAKTIKQAKQFISHKKIFINCINANKRTNYICKKGDLICYKEDKDLGINKSFYVGPRKKFLPYKKKFLISKTLEFLK